MSLRQASRSGFPAWQDLEIRLESLTSILSMEPNMNKKTVQFTITALVSIALIIMAHLAAGSMAQRGQLPVVPQDLNYFRVIFSIVVTILLITPAFCLFVFQGRKGPSDNWRNLYTFAYVAY